MINDTRQTNTAYLQRTAQPADAREIAAVFAESFVFGEPLVIACNINEHEFRPVAESVVKHAIPQGLTQLVQHPQTREIVGVFILIDCHSKWEGDDLDDRLSPKFIPLFALLEEMALRFQGRRTFARAEVLEGFAMAVSPQYRRTGIGNLLLEASMNKAREQGFKQFFGSYTNPISARIFLQRQAKVQATYAYDDWVFENTMPFKQLKGYEALALFVDL